MEFVIYVALILFGACLGSFAGATVWRLRARQLVGDKKNGEKVDAKEFKRLESLAKTPLNKDHSHCLHCQYELKWYDLIPVVSWLSLGGKCRHCRKPIGRFELLIELGMIAFFVASYIFWPFDLVSGLAIAQFVVWLVAGVVLAMLFAYDAKWFLLPDVLTALLAALGAVTVALLAFQSFDPLSVVLNALGAVGILSGLYGVLYLISRGAWIGMGDIKLGVGLALLLIDWKLAIIALFLANLIGCLIVIPLMIKHTLKRNSHIPFGPLLIAGMILAQFIGPFILSFYVDSLI